MSYHIADWELTYPSYPRPVLQYSIKWVRLDGSTLVPEDRQPLPNNLHFSWDSLDRAIDGEAQVDVHSLVFADPSSFIAGQLTCSSWGMGSNSRVILLSVSFYSAGLGEKQSRCPLLFSPL